MVFGTQNNYLPDTFDCELDITLGVGDRLPVVEGFKGRQVVHVPLHQVR